MTEAFKRGYMDKIAEVASASSLPEPLLQYAVADVYDKARNWMSPEELVDYIDSSHLYAPLYENDYGTLDKKSLTKDLKRGDTSGSPLDLDSRKVPYRKKKVLFGLLPDDVEEDLGNAVVDDSGTQRLRKMETDFLRDMYVSGEDEDRKEVKRLLKSYLFKHDLDDLIKGK